MFPTFLRYVPIILLECPEITKVEDPAAAPGYGSIKLFLPLPQDKIGCCQQLQTGSFSLDTLAPQTHDLWGAVGYAGLFLPKSEPLGTVRLAMRFIQSHCRSCSSRTQDLPHLGTSKPSMVTQTGSTVGDSLGCIVHFSFPQNLKAGEPTVYNSHHCHYKLFSNSVFKAFRHL